MLDITKPLTTRGGHEVIAVAIDIDLNDNDWPISTLIRDKNTTNVKASSHTIRGEYGCTEVDSEYDLIYDTAKIEEMEKQQVPKFVEKLKKFHDEIAFIDVLANESFVKVLANNWTLQKEFIDRATRIVGSAINKLVENDAD